MKSESIGGSDQNESRLLDVAESDVEIVEASEDKPDTLGGEILQEPDEAQSLATPIVDIAMSDICPELPDADLPPLPPSPRLRRWISTLRRRKQTKQIDSIDRNQPFISDSFGSRPASPMKRRDSQHKKSNSNCSSLAFITAVRSATATIASASITTVSRRHTAWRRGHQRSSVISGSDPRPSIDSQRSVMDEAARQRSRKRRDKVEELIRTEESYVADIKALSNVREST